jgi:mono/diheme cytochrome c family protein
MSSIRGIRIAAALGGLGLLGIGPSLAAQDRVVRPAEVTDSAVAQGRELFHGSGGCSACHGIEGIGTDSGPPLALGVWLYGADTFDAIRSRVIHGIPRAYSLHDVPMPMRGWSALSDEEIRQVAAYVWWISHPKKPS